MKMTEEIFREIYEAYWPPLFRHAHKMLQDPEEAKDVVQEVFTMLWTKAPGLEIKTSLSSFLYAAVRNNVFNRIDRGKVRQKYLSAIGDFADRGRWDLSDELIAKELAKRFETALQELPPGMRRVFELSRIEQLSYHEIRDELRVTEHTVRKQISNALKILRGKLAGLFYLIFF